MKLKINIFDLSWCRFYLYDKRFDIGFPLADASLSMAIFVELFVVGLFIFPSVIEIYELPKLSRLPFIIGGIVVCLFFILRHRNEDVRNERLALYEKYKKEYPRKTLIRFIAFLAIPVSICLADCIITIILQNKT